MSNESAVPSFRARISRADHNSLGVRRQRNVDCGNDVIYLVLAVVGFDSRVFAGAFTNKIGLTT